MNRTEFHFFAIGNQEIPQSLAKKTGILPKQRSGIHPKTTRRIGIATSNVFGHNSIVTTNLETRLTWIWNSRSQLSIHATLVSSLDSSCNSNYEQKRLRSRFHFPVLLYVSLNAAKTQIRRAGGGWGGAYLVENGSSGKNAPGVVRTSRILRLFRRILVFFLYKKREVRTIPRSIDVDLKRFSKKTWKNTKNEKNMKNTKIWEKTRKTCETTFFFFFLKKPFSQCMVGGHSYVGKPLNRIRKPMSNKCEKRRYQKQMSGLGFFTVEKKYSEKTDKT